MTELPVTSTTLGASLYDVYAQARADPRPLDVLTQIVTDDLFRSGGLHVADARAGSRPVYAYQFEVSSRLLDGALGATHCMELPFTFANISRWGLAPFIQGLPPEVIERVTGVLHNAWIGFARDGDPNHEGAPYWQAYTAETAPFSSSGTKASGSRPTRSRPYPPVRDRGH